MAVNIKNREVEFLIDELKRETGMGTTELILHLARREVEKRRRLRTSAERRARIEAIVRRYRARLPAHPASPDEIIGYDADGLPR